MGKAKQGLNKRKKEGVKIELTSTFALINKLNCERSYDLVNSNIPTGAIGCKLEKYDRYFSFNIYRRDSYELPVLDSNVEDDLLNPCKLVSEELTLLAETARSTNREMKDDLSIYGKYWELKSESFNNDGYYRVIIPISDKQFKLLDLSRGKDLVIDGNYRYFSEG